MSEREPRDTSQQRVGVGFVLMLLFSSLGILATAPAASAAVSGSLGVVASHSPLEDSWHSSFQTITFSAEVENKYPSPSGSSRTLMWYACEGDVTVPICKSIYTNSGSFSLANIPGNTNTTSTSAEVWSPGSTSEGIFTIVYAFLQNDQDSSDDAYRFNINLTNDFVDVSVSKTQNPMQHLTNLSIYDGMQILNSDTDYVFKAKGVSTICGNCVFSGEFGWQLWDSEGTMMLTEAYRTVSNLPAWGGYDPLNVNLPAFSYAEQGNYLLKYGLFSSTGTPYSDLNVHNNIATFPIVINDSIDVRVSDVYPSHGAAFSEFYFGTDRVVAEFENLGNMTVRNMTASFNVYNQQYESEVEDTCEILILHPGQTTTCDFDLTTTGASRLMRIQLPTVFQDGEDVRMGDNLFSLTTNVQIGAINPYIQTNSENEIYLSDDDVELVARSSSIASQPLNYTWREGFYNWGHGQVLNKTGAEFGLGLHTLSLQVTDPWGNSEYSTVEFEVLNAVSFGDAPQYQGTAVTLEDATLSHELLLPELGQSYSIGGGNSPLMLLSIDVEGTGGSDGGLRGIDVEMNLSAILPDNIDLSTVDLRYLSSPDSQLWTYIEGESTYEFNADNTAATVSLVDDGVVLIVGHLPATDVHGVDVDWQQRKDGQISLSWNSIGDTTNPYVGGWKIYKIQGITGTTVFPEPADGVSDNVWEELTENTHVATLDIEASEWLDPEHLPTGICASYAIAPTDREGNPNYAMINITRVDGSAGLLCGDAIPPSTELDDFQHSWEFTNSTDCFDTRNDWSVCYNVTLTWTWPNHEPQGNLTWNMYRVEFAPENVDLKFVEPIATGLQGTPGEQGTFIQSGMQTDGIRPYRTYYYILAPIDAVGNELMTANFPSPNTERVHIDDDWWAYNQHIIPPEPEPPEPPLGMPWLQKLNDATQVSEFQLAGVVLLSIIVVNFILLPLILKKRKRLKRVLEARKRNTVAMDEFDDFFE